MTKHPRVSKIFDPTKLDAMNEPLTVRVEKMKNGSRMPIPLPPGEDGSPQGTNWSKEDVNGLEQWLVNEWSGGGLYAITILDSSLPSPIKHDWEVYFHPPNHPEKIPPTLTASALPPTSPQQSAQPQPAQVRSMSTFPNGLPGGLQGGVPPQQVVYVDRPVQQQQQPMQQPMQQQPFQPTLAANAAAEAERRRYEDQLKVMSDQLARQREEMLQSQFRQELDRKLADAKAEQNANNERFSRMEQLIEKMITTNSRPGVDPALEQLKEQNRMLAAQAENERREREAERREREMRDLITRQQDDTRRQIEAMNAQLVAQQLAATANKGPDPMIMFLQENARQQVEATKEASRNQTTQMAQLQSFMMNPRDIMAMTKESSNGLDNVTRQITSTYQSILEMQRSAVEQILQLNQGGGNETIQLIEKGLDRASSFAERFIGGKTKEAVSAQQSQAQLAQANATAMQAQAQAMSAQASLQAQAARQQQAQPSGLNGLNGARVAAPSPTPALVSPHKDDAWGTAPVPPPPATVQMAKRTLGHTDEEWFGPIMPKVVELREGVARFIESLQQSPARLKKDGSVDGIEPGQAASVILQAAMIVMQQQIPITAMMDLLGQGRVADFMDVLIPDAPQPYRDEVAQMVLKELNGGDVDDDDEDEDADVDGEDDENEVEVVAQPPVKPAQPAKPGPRARA